MQILKREWCWRDRVLSLKFLQEVQEDPAVQWIHGGPSVPSLQPHQPLPYLHGVLVVPWIKVLHKRVPSHTITLDKSWLTLLEHVIVYSKMNLMFDHNWYAYNV